jgi:hypothetical protein
MVRKDGQTQLNRQFLPADAECLACSAAGCGMSNLVSLSEALEGYFDKPLKALPDALV